MNLNIFEVYCLEVYAQLHGHDRHIIMYGSNRDCQYDARQ